MASCTKTKLLLLIERRKLNNFSSAIVKHCCSSNNPQVKSSHIKRSLLGVAIQNTNYQTSKLYFCLGGYLITAINLKKNLIFMIILQKIKAR